ncbi:MAG: single-stranded-DNA-specific exonuclease RecJ [Planctomycetaceae bacterium]
MARHWRFAPHDPAVISTLVRQLHCSPLLAQVLAARGVRTAEVARRFQSSQLKDLHDPNQLPGVTAAAQIIAEAIRAGRRITVYGDYDVDGVTATAILWHCVRLAGGKVDYYIPHRVDEGYGLNLEAIRKLHEEDPQRVVVTVDCGICSVAEASLAQELGLTLIITDHHTLSDSLPQAAALVHPSLPGSEYPFRGLCGAGVAFKLAWALCQQLGDGERATPKMRDFLISAVGLAAIGTIADVVPLVDENRILVHNGLVSLAQRAPLGVSTLMKVANIEQGRTLVSEDIGFAIAPRINAAGRLGQARLAVELLTTTDQDRALQLAQYVDQLNRDRQTVERRMLKQARELVEEHGWEDEPALVLAHPEWHPGVIGIVAGRVAEKYERPAIMIALDEAARCGAGSARSFAGYDLYAALHACQQHLTGFGGHRAAAGLRLQQDALDGFRAAFSSYVRETLQLEEGDTDFPVDAEVSLADLTLPAVKEIDTLGPFGCENPRPIFVTENVTLAGPPKTMGGGDRHLALRVKQAGRIMRGVAFGKGEWAADFERHSGPFAICYRASINRFQGRESVEFQLIDWQPSSTAATV